MRHINHRCPKEDGRGSAVCCLFQHKTQPPNGNEPKRKLKSDKLKRNLREQLSYGMKDLPRILFTRTAVWFWKLVSHKLLEEMRVFSGSITIYCPIPSPRYSLLFTVRDRTVE